MFKGVLTVKPPLPTIYSTDAVKPTIRLKAKISHCEGPVTGSGLVTFTKKMTVAVNCASKHPSWLRVNEHIKWSDGKTSGVSALIPFASTGDSYNGAVHAGAFRRHHQITRLRGTAGSDGTCFTKPLSSSKVSLVKGVKFVIK